MSLDNEEYDEVLDLRTDQAIRRHLSAVEALILEEQVLRDRWEARCARTRRRNPPQEPWIPPKSLNTLRFSMHLENFYEHVATLAAAKFLST